jgi:hypothetical protein
MLTIAPQLYLTGPARIVAVPPPTGGWRISRPDLDEVGLAWFLPSLPTGKQAGERLVNETVFTVQF